MDRTALHLEIRNALSIADELSRYEHALGNVELSAHLSALRTSLDELEREFGRSHDAAEATSPKPQTVDAVERGASMLRSRRDEIPNLLRPRLSALVASVDRITFGIARPYARVPSKPLLGVLPLARVVPQDMHTIMVDWGGSMALMASAKLARTPAARAAGMTLAMSATSVSLLTDYRLSAAKLVPIEVHEVADWGVGLGAMLAPFVLGYARKDPIATLIQVATGFMTCVSALITDYRAQRGISIPMRSKGGPDAIDAEIPRSRLPEAQRPLEGLSSAPTDWQPDTQWINAR